MIVSEADFINAIKSTIQSNSKEKRMEAEKQISEYIKNKPEEFAKIAINIFKEDSHEIMIRNLSGTIVNLKLENYLKMV